jgi:large subunit ribosomal protein L25
MAETAVLNIEPRAARGKWAMRRLRAAGVVPGIVYGHGVEPQPIQLSAELLLSTVRHGARLVELAQPAGPEKALIREVQWDPFGQEILHVDFARVSADERIHVEVRVELRGSAPGVEEGGVLEHYVHTIEIECLATEIPEEIRVDVRGLHLGQAVHVRELVLPPGVNVLADPDIVVVQVAEQKVEAAVPGEAEVAAAAVEPEIVGRRVAAEPEAEAEGEKKGGKK